MIELLKALLALGNYIVAMRGGTLLCHPNLGGDCNNPVSTAFYKLFEHIARESVLQEWRPRISRSCAISPLLTLSYFLENIPDNEVYLRTLLTNLLRLFRKDLKVQDNIKNEGFAHVKPELPNNPNCGALRVQPNQGLLVTSAKGLLLLFCDEISFDETALDLLKKLVAALSVDGLSLDDPQIEESGDSGESGDIFA
jgi:hypothetical protein